MTFQFQFDLYDKAWIVDLMQSLMMAGYMVGCIIFGQLSDSFGRRIPALIGKYLMQMRSLITFFENQ